MEFIHTVGIPNTIVSDSALEETRGRSGEIMQEYRIHLQTKVPHSPWQNRAEACSRERRNMFEKSSIERGQPYDFGPTVQRGVQWYNVLLLLVFPR
jgi:hypothetical protein